MSRHILRSLSPKIMTWFSTTSTHEIAEHLLTVFILCYSVVTTALDETSLQKLQIYNESQKKSPQALTALPHSRSHTNVESSMSSHNDVESNRLRPQRVMSLTELRSPAAPRYSLIVLFFWVPVEVTGRAEAASGRTGAASGQAEAAPGRTEAAPGRAGTVPDKRLLWRYPYSEKNVVTVKPDLYEITVNVSYNWSVG